MERNDEAALVAGDILEVVIEQGHDRERDRPCPIAYLPSGKVIVLPRDTHDRVGIGQIWKVRVEANNPSYIFAVPETCVSEFDAFDKSVFPPEVTAVVTKTLTGKLQQEEEVAQSFADRLEVLNAEIAELERERDLHVDKRNTLEAALKEAARRVEMFRRAIERISPSDAPVLVSDGQGGLRPVQRSEEEL